MLNVDFQVIQACGLKPRMFCTENRGLRGCTLLSFAQAVLASSSPACLASWLSAHLVHHHWTFPPEVTPGRSGFCLSSEQGSKEHKHFLKTARSVERVKTCYIPEVLFAVRLAARSGANSEPRPGCAHHQLQRTTKLFLPVEPWHETYIEQCDYKKRHLLVS